ncbi:conserved protein of unknown function [Ruminococcaceae bacterium BL-6]|nr:conserved protein of unknown function [Ruminococcaceae bacterium BL-6]
MSKKTDEKKMLELLAYGDVTDAVKLLLEVGKAMPDPAVIDGLDLRNVSAIRYTSAGGFELSFYDRFRALDGLRKLNDASKAGGLLSAIQASAPAAFDDEREYLSRHED